LADGLIQKLRDCKAQIKDKKRQLDLYMKAKQLEIEELEFEHEKIQEKLFN